MEEKGKEGSGLPEISGVQLLAPTRHLTFPMLSFITLGGCWGVCCNNAFIP